MQEGFICEAYMFTMYHNFYNPPLVGFHYLTHIQEPPQMEVAWATGPREACLLQDLGTRELSWWGQGVLLVKRCFPIEPQLGSSRFEQLQSTDNCPEHHT